MADEAKKKVKKEKIARAAMPEQEPAVRARNFLEVPTGYTPEMAKQEAKRCLQCKKPGCVAGCPVGIVYTQRLTNPLQFGFTEELLSSGLLNTVECDD